MPPTWARCIQPLTYQRVVQDWPLLYTRTRCDADPSPCTRAPGKQLLLLLHPDFSSVCPFCPPARSDEKKLGPCFGGLVANDISIITLFLIPHSLTPLLHQPLCTSPPVAAVLTSIAVCLRPVLLLHRTDEVALTRPKLCLYRGDRNGVFAPSMPSRQLSHPPARKPAFGMFKDFYLIPRFRAQSCRALCLYCAKAQRHCTRWPA